MDGPVIEGLRKEDDAAFYASVERVMRLFGLKKLQVDLNSCIPNAQGKSKLLRDHLIFSPKMLGLMKKMGKDEAECILAHEMSHIYYRDYHVLVGMLFLFTLPTLLFLLHYLARCLLFRAPTVVFYRNGWFILSLLFFFFGIRAVLWASRKCEERADREAVIKIRSPEALKGALAKIAASMVRTPGRPGTLQQICAILINIFFYISGSPHPTMQERFRQIDLLNEMFIDDSAYLKYPLSSNEP
jgi:hypothetical protein